MIYDTLDEYDVVVADPQQTKAIGITEVKNDGGREAASSRDWLAVSPHAGQVASSHACLQRRSIYCEATRATTRLP